MAAMETSDRVVAGEEGSTRAPALVAMVSMIGFVVLVILGGALTDGYSHVTQKISELGATGAQYAVLQNVNFVILGIGLTAFAWALHRTPGTASLPSILVGFFGVVAFAHAFVSCDVGCKGETTMGLLHNVTGLMGFVSVIAAMLLSTRQWGGIPVLAPYVRLTRVLAFTAIGGLLAFVATQALDVQDFAGIVQRVFAGSFILWVGVVGYGLSRTAGSDAQKG